MVMRYSDDSQGAGRRQDKSDVRLIRKFLKETSSSPKSAPPYARRFSWQGGRGEDVRRTCGSGHPVEDYPWADSQAPDNLPEEEGNPAPALEEEKDMMNKDESEEIHQHDPEPTLESAVADAHEKLPVEEVEGRSDENGHEPEPHSPEDKLLLAAMEAIAQRSRAEPSAPASSEPAQASGSGLGPEERVAESGPQEGTSTQAGDAAAIGEESGSGPALVKVPVEDLGEGIAQAMTEVVQGVAAGGRKAWDAMGTGYSRLFGKTVKEEEAEAPRPQTAVPVEDLGEGVVRALREAGDGVTKVSEKVATNVAAAARTAASVTGRVAGRVAAAVARPDGSSAPVTAEQPEAAAKPGETFAKGVGDRPAE